MHLVVLLLLICSSSSGFNTIRVPHTHISTFKRSDLSRLYMSAEVSPSAPSVPPLSLKESISKTLKVAYKFSRPHTIKGTILASFMGVTRALQENPGSMSWALLPRAAVGLVALLCGNAYIVGVNQIYDVEIDKINKPFLPIAAKDLTIKKAWTWVLASLVTGGVIVKTQFSPLIFRLYCLGGLLGTLYSVISTVSHPLASISIFISICFLLT